MIGATDITTIFGQRGSGKSDMGRAISSLYPRLVVIDILREWKACDADFITDEFDKATKFLEEKIGEKKFRLVFQFDIDTKSEEQLSVFNAFLRTLYMRGECTGENVCLLIEEVQFFSTSGSAEEWLFKLATVGRHANLAMIMSSQRPAQVAKVLVSQAQNRLIGQLAEKNDIEYLRKTVGDVAEQAATLPQYDFIFHRMGEEPVVVDKFHFTRGEK